MRRAAARANLPRAMRAMLLERPGAPLREVTLPRPVPGPGQVLIEVAACAVCRTDLHVVDGELPDPKLPLMPGHEIVGRVSQGARASTACAIGDRVGVPWLGWTCGACAYCRSGRENLCDRARFTGYQIDGGFAEFAVADHRFCFPLPDGYGDVEAAPLLCAGLIGYRALAAAGDARRLGHLRLRRGGAHHRPGRRPRGARGLRLHPPRRQRRRRRSRASLGAAWAGGSDETPPERARRRDHLRAGGRARPDGACARSPRAAPSSAPGST